MQSLYLTKPGHIELRETPIPPLGEEEVLVKVAYCGICTLEQRLYTGEREIHYPLIPGHEASGVVVEVGPKIMTNIKVGEAVALDLVNRCHACGPCLKGDTNLCENRFKSGQRVLGAFSEFVVVKPYQVHPVAPALPLEEAAFGEPLACSIRSLKRARLSLGDPLLISGAGTMGLLHLKLAKIMGLKPIMCDPDKERLKRAQKEGALTFTPEECLEGIKEVTGGHGVTASVVTTVATQAVEVAVNSLATTGTLLLYTSYGGELLYPFDLNEIHQRELTITGSEGRSGEDFRQAVRLLSNRTIQVNDLITNIYPLSRAEEAFKEALSPHSYRILIKMEGL